MSRTPHPVGTVRRTAASGIGRRAEDDQPIDGQCTVRRGDDRVQVDRDDVRSVPGQLADGHDEVGQGVTVDRPSSACAGQQGRTTQRCEQPHRLGSPKRGKADGGVVQDLGKDAAEADDDSGPEQCVAGQPDDELEALGRPSARRGRPDVEPGAAPKVEQLCQRLR